MLREYQDAIASHGVTQRARHGDERVARRRRTATTSSIRSSSSSASGPSCSAARRRRGSSSSARPSGSTEPAPYLVVDVGGGSTEFIVGTDEPDGLISVDVGCVRLTEQVDDSSLSDLDDCLHKIRLI